MNLFLNRKWHPWNLWNGWLTHIKVGWPRKHRSKHSMFKQIVRKNNLHFICCVNEWYATDIIHGHVYLRFGALNGLLTKSHSFIHFMQRLKPHRIRWAKANVHFFHVGLPLIWQLLLLYWYSKDFLWFEET